MSVFNIFDNDAFGVVRMSEGMRELKYVPSFIGSLGLFTERFIDTLNVAIEKDKDQQYSIVPSSPRGGVGDTVGKGRRQMRILRIPHFQREDGIMADEVQGVRAFNEQEAVQTIQGKIADRAGEHLQSFELTAEYHRLNVLMSGLLLDADGSTLYNFFTEFGESQPAEVDWDLDNATPADGILRQRSATMARAMGTALGGLPYRGILALAGDTFYDQLTQHKEVRDTYKNWSDAQSLRNSFIGLDNASVNTGIWAAFEIYGIRWINYRGGLGVTIPATTAKFFPLGVPGLFQSIYGPADYIETVNRPGEKLYAKQMVMQNHKGVALEYQTNVLHFCNRPRVLMSARNT